MTPLQVQAWYALRAEVAELISALQDGNIFSAVRSNSKANQWFSMLSVTNRQMVAFTMLRNVLYSVEGVVAPADVTLEHMQEWDFLRIAMAMTEVVREGAPSPTYASSMLVTQGDYWLSQNRMQRTVLTFPLECTLFYLNNTRAYEDLHREPLRNITNRIVATV